MYVFLCAPWCGVETPWVSKGMSGGGLPRVTHSVARSGIDECTWDLCVAACALVWGGNPMGE